VKRARSNDGFALAEVLTAMVMIAVGLLAAAGALHFAADTLESSRRDTVSLLLAEQRLEMLKAHAVADWHHVEVAAGVQIEACDPIAMTCRTGGDETSVLRTTAITDAPGGRCGPRCKLVHVTVRSRFGGEHRVELATLLTSRP
jgi:prepilin-type N-terminal cleavage/methylation domain-containing protein